MWSLSLLATLSLNATYSVYKVKGEVDIKYGSKTRKAEKRSEVRLTDHIVIPQGGEIKILDSDTKKVYTFSTPGANTLASMKRQMEDKAMGIISRTNRELRSSMTENSGRGPSVYKKGGISIHNSDAIVYGATKVPEGKSYLEFLMTLTNPEDYDDSNDALLLRRDMADDGDTFGFAVFNTTSEPLYFNVIPIGMGSVPNTLFDINPLARPKGETVETEYQFAVPGKKSGYILVASTENFTLDDLRKLLDPSFEPNADYYFTMLFK